MDRFRTFVAENLFSFLFTLLLLLGIWLAVKSHNFSVLGIVAIIVFIVVLDRFLSQWRSKNRKLMEGLSGDHKLISDYVSVVDTGNFRFIYHVYSSPKTRLSMNVGIPFPSCAPDVKADVRRDMQNLINSLKEEGMLVYSNPIISDEVNNVIDNEEVTWIGQPLILEFDFKRVTSDWLNRLQGKVLDIIEKYGLQELEFCTVREDDRNAEYSLVRGNMQSGVVVRSYFDGSLRRCSFKASQDMFLTQKTALFDVGEYRIMSESAFVPPMDCSFDSLENVVRTLFPSNGKDCKVKFSKTDDEFIVNIDVVSKQAASKYHLVHESGFWWMYAHGRLDNYNPISTEDEHYACNMFINAIMKYADKNDTVN